MWLGKSSRTWVGALQGLKFLLILKDRTCVNVNTLLRWCKEKEGAGEGAWNLLVINHQKWSLTLYCYVCLSAKSLQFCPTVCNPMSYSPPGSSVHGILQIRILEWVVISFLRGSSRPRDQTPVSYFSCIGKWILYHQCYLESPSIIMCSLLLLWILKGFK